MLFVTVVYNPTNSELVRTNTLTKGAIVQIDATPFRQFYVSKYNSIMGVKKGKEANPVDKSILDRKKSKHLLVRMIIVVSDLMLSVFSAVNVGTLFRT